MRDGILQEESLVVGLGVDLVELDRVARSLDRWGHRLIARIMAPDEAARLPPGKERSRALALAIAGKEAASKAIGTGWSRGVTWRDVVVRFEPTPSVVLRGAAVAAALALGGSGETRAKVEIRGGLALAEVRLLG